MSQVSAVRDRKVTPHNATALTIPINYPDLVEADDLLVLMATVATSNITASGWTSLGEESAGGVAGHMFHRTADGTEGGGTFDITMSPNIRDANCIVWSIRNEVNPGTPEAASQQHAVTSDPFDPPALTPTGGDRLYLWIVAGYLDSTAALTAWDSTLDGRINHCTVTNVDVGAVGAERLLSAASFDPASMTKSASQEWGAWTVAIPVDQPANGNFPIIETTSQGSWPTAAATQSMTLPTGVTAGDVLTATIANVTASVTITGWDVIVERENDTGGTVRGTLLQRTADGTEGASVTVNFSASSGGSFICRRISGADGTNTEAATASNSNAAANLYPTWPSLTPAAGADDIMWLADICIRDDRFQTGWNPNYGELPLSEQDGGSVSEGVGAGVLTRNQATALPDDGRLNAVNYTVTITAAVYPAAAAPAAPTNPAAAALSDSSIRVTWDDVADETGYRVERSDDGIAGWADVSGNLAADTVLFDDTGLTASTQYFYRVFAFNAVGDSDPSTVVNATTDAAAGGGNRMGGTGAIRKPPRRN